MKRIIGLITPLIFIQTLFFKFTAAPESVYIFTKVGMESWGRYLTGILELISSICFLFPRWSWLGAALAIDIMIGAIFSHLTLLGIVVQDDSGLLFGMALAVFFSSSFTLYQERYSIPMIGKILKQSDDLARNYDSNVKASFGHRLPIILILSFAFLCAVGIFQQVLSINFILTKEFPAAAELSIAKWSYFMTLLSVLITFLLTVLVVKIFEAPLNELILVCQNIAKGDRSTRSNLPLNSELGILSASLNQMLNEVQAQEVELKERSLSIQKLLRIVIHDVANPLMVIMSASKLATKNKEELSQSQLTYWTRVANASSKIEGIIRSTRDFEAIRSGVKKIELKKISVLDCLQSVIDIFAERAQKKGIEFKIENLTGLPHPEVLAEETLFASSVVSNIVSNAIKFSDENSLIKFLITQSAPHQIRLSITDQGVGLPLELIEKFTKGGTIESHRGTQGEIGTGFGLDIARSIMKSMNGDLTLESKWKTDSEKDHGTTVHLILAEG